MAIEVSTGLTDLVEELNRNIKEATAQSKVTNLLLLGQAKSLDASEPIARERLSRNLALIENAVRGEVA